MSPKKYSNTETMRKRREKLKEDPIAYAAYKVKENERYQRRKAHGKIKTIHDLDERSQRNLRRKWRLDKRKKRGAACNDNAASNTIPDTPPATPLTGPVPPQVPSHQMVAGRKRVKRENRQAYRTIDKQKKKIDELKKQIRSLKRHAKKQCTDQGSQPLNDAASPATKTERVLKAGKKSEVRRAILFGFALSAEVKDKLKKTANSNVEKHVIHRIVTGRIMKKYKLLDRARKEMSLSKCRQGKISKKVAGNRSLLENCRKVKHGLGQTTELVKVFFTQDANSVPSSGKRETITRYKVKKQKRYLTDTLLNLFEKFKSEYPTNKLSYTSFTRLKPFYCVSPSVTGRDTVKCKIHCNTELKAAKLYTLGYLRSQNLTNVISAVVCSPDNHSCMYGKCNTCSKKVDDLVLPATKCHDVVTYYEWQSKMEDRVTIKGTITVKMLTKLPVITTVSELAKAFLKDMSQVMPHQYRIVHQFKAIKAIKQKMASNECVLQVDYSENYSCKGTEEIQAMHFGANRRQVSLHTCHATLRGQDGQLYTKCYCSLSDDTKHTPAAVWAHLDPVLSDLQTKGVTVIHFVSDGPTSQYRNKSNFYLMSTIPFDLYGFHLVYWNFLEASHGKGPADGIGAAVKCTADRMVATGRDILDVTTLYDCLVDNINVELYRIYSEDILKVERLLQESNIDPIKGTMQIHQVICKQQASLTHRKLSCYCTYSANTTADLCGCFQPVEIIHNHVEKSDAIVRLEKELSSSQIKKFETRLSEGYDIVQPNLAELSVEDRSEYVYWKAWRGAMLAHSGQTSEQPKSPVSDSDDTQDNQDPDWEPLVGSTVPPTDLKIENYYAVFFKLRTKKTFYIGHPIELPSCNGTMVRIKFLEKKCGQPIFDWPRTHDIEEVETSRILCRVHFEGPPPFTLDMTRSDEILKIATNFTC